MNDLAGLVYKQTVRIDKHHGGDTSHEPDEVLEISQWVDKDGSIITDPERIAQLERENGPSDSSQ